MLHFSKRALTKSFVVKRVNVFANSDLNFEAAATNAEKNIEEMLKISNHHSGAVIQYRNSQGKSEQAIIHYSSCKGNKVDHNKEPLLDSAGKIMNVPNKPTGVHSNTIPLNPATPPSTNVEVKEEEELTKREEDFSELLRDPSFLRGLTTSTNKAVLNLIKRDKIVDSHGVAISEKDFLDDE